MSISKTILLVVAVCVLSCCGNAGRRSAGSGSDSAGVAEPAMSRADSVEAARLRDSAEFAERKRKWAEESRQEELRDSLKYAREPLIHADEAAHYNKALKEWADYYGVEIAQFRLSGESSFDPEEFLTIDDDQENLFYCGRFDAGDDYYDCYIPQLNDYSPNKRRYVNVLEATVVYQDEEDGKWYFNGSDDSQSLCFVDRDRRIIKYLFNTGTAFIDGAFWPDNDCFVLAHYSTHSDEYCLYAYDLVAGTRRHWRLKAPIGEDKYFLGYKMELLGIIDRC